MTIEKYSNSNNFLEVEYIRAIAIVLLLLWHCFFCPMFVWPICEWHTDMLYFSIVSNFIIPDATMPLFTFISGYLFVGLYLNRNKYHEFKGFLKNKIKRLLIPFFILSIFVILTSYNLHIDRIWKGEGSHLWYCAMLFWCFIIGWCVLQLKSSLVSVITFSLSTLLVFLYPNFWFLPFELPLGIDNSMYYYSYFAYGGGVFVIGKQLSKYLTSGVLLLSFSYFFIFVATSFSLYHVGYIANFMKPYLLCLLLWFLIKWLLSKGWIYKTVFITNLSNYGFGIYVLHHWLAWNIVWIPFMTPILKEHYIIFPFVLLIVVSILSYYLTKLALFTKVGRFLLL